MWRGEEQGERDGRGTRVVAGIVRIFGGHLRFTQGQATVASRPLSEQTADRTQTPALECSPAPHHGLAYP